MIMPPMRHQMGCGRQAVEIPQLRTNITHTSMGRRELPSHRGTPAGHPAQRREGPLRDSPPKGKKARKVQVQWIAKIQEQRPAGEDMAPRQPSVGAAERRISPVATQSPRSDGAASLSTNASRTGRASCWWINLRYCNRTGGNIPAGCHHGGVHYGE